MKMVKVTTVATTSVECRLRTSNTLKAARKEIRTEKIYMGQKMSKAVTTRATKGGAKTYLMI